MNLFCHDSDLCATLVLARRANSRTNLIFLSGSRISLWPHRGSCIAHKLQCDSNIFLDPRWSHITAGTWLSSCGATAPSFRIRTAAVIFSGAAGRQPHLSDVKARQQHLSAVASQQFWPCPSRLTESLAFCADLSRKTIEHTCIWIWSMNTAPMPQWLMTGLLVIHKTCLFSVPRQRRRHLRSAPLMFVKVSKVTTRLHEAVENRSIRVVVIVAAPTPCWASGCQGAHRGNCSTSSQRDCVQRQSWKFAPSRRSVAFVVPKQTW